MENANISGGFSLLEVLVAFTITSLILGVVFQIYAKGARSARLGEEYTQAVTIAKSKLAMLGRSESLDVHEYQGTDNGKFHWTITIEDYHEEEAIQDVPVLHLKAVSLKVGWVSGGKHLSIQFHSLRPVLDHEG